MLIDDTYFTGELHVDGLVPSKGVPSLTNEAIKSEFFALAKKFEKEYYVHILGRENANEFINFLNLKEKDPDKATDKKWLNLINILVDDENGRKESPIAYYIYFFYLKRNQLEVTPLGVTEADANIAPCNKKMIDSWNQMAYMNEYISKWLFDNRNDYGGYFFELEMIEVINQLGI